jgi:eukaryotic-like serine/threonine-protein kinase
MNPEQWKRVKQSLEEAIALDPVDRSAYLDRVCEGDHELRHEMESLVSSHEQAGTGFLKTPAVDLHRSVPAARSRVGCRIGAYDILEEIGHGGMGEVYRAARADGQFTKDVAVKLVRGGFDTALVVERFRHERQILAGLEHPNIGRLLDGGTTEDGIPYLVMELVKGMPVDEYCRTHRLDVSSRLRLFLHVCAAVQYAHQRLVIHRDIKPGNILVTEEGVPKLLDFGIAKILDPSVSSDATVSPLTPEYASPEQIRGDPITTATDVYSLGVVLYRLLTGQSPYPPNTRTPHEFARAICESEPKRPSIAIYQTGRNDEPISDRETITPPEAFRSWHEDSLSKLRRRLRGDLDLIVLKALRKEPQGRYASVEQMADDIQRHLEGLPVTVRRDSWRYRAGRFATRHKLAVTATVLVVIAVLGGVAATLHEARIAAANGHRAEQRFNDVRKLANSLMFEIHDAIRDLPGSTPARRLLVTRALEYLDTLSAQSKGDVSLQKELATAYERVGDVLGFPYGANLGDKDGALQSYRKALAIRQSLAVAGLTDAQLRSDLIETYYRVALVLESSGNFAEALEAARRGRVLTIPVASGNRDPALADQYAGGYYFTAGLQVQTGDVAAARDNYQRAAAIREAALQSHPDNLSLRSHLAADYAGIAKCSEQEGDLSHAAQMQAKAAAILEEVSQSNPGNVTFSEYVGEATNRLATYRKEQGESAAALETYRKAHQIFGDLLTADPKNSLAKSNFGFSDNGIGLTLTALGRPASAARIFREAIASFEEMSPATTSNRYVRTGLAQAYSGLGEVYSILAIGKHTPSDQKREYWQEARSSCEKSLALWNEKEKRRELESSEQNEAAQVAQCVAKSEAEIHHLGRKQGSPY